MLISKLDLVTKSLVLFLFLATFSATAQAPLDIRVALVIGNSSYKEVPRLVNPQNDAKAMSLMLKKLGFQVISVVDGTKKDIDAAIQNMKASLQGRQAVAMIYYAGHGIQHNWDNYIIPVDFKNNSNIDLANDAVNLKNILDVFSQSKTRMNIIVLDACRDNPFGSQLGSNKGLAQVDAPINTYIAFATAPGNVAQDGDDRSGYGLFTGYLIKELQQPAAIEDVFKRVRLQVRKSSGGMQIPWDSSSLENDFSFNDGKKYTVQPNEFLKELADEKNKEEKVKLDGIATKIQNEKLQAEKEKEKERIALLRDKEELDKKAKLLVDQKKKEEALKNDIEANKKKIPSVENLSGPIQLANIDRIFKPIEATQNSDLASEKSDWEKIKDSNNVNDFYTFLYKYPNGLLSANANFKLEELDKRKITAQTDKNGFTESLGLFKVKPGDLFTYSVVDKRSIFGTKERFNNFRVDKIQDGLVYLLVNAYREEIRTLSGGYVSGYSDGQPLSFNPPRQDLPGEPLFVGKKWASVSFQKSGNFESARTDKFQVLGIEEVTTPAGTFKTFKIEMNGQHSNSTINQIYWIDADSGIRVKTIRIVNNHRNSNWNVNEISTLINKVNIY
jgi:uncharacterized caspase-like protein